jgi:uncharacterized protein YvpB
MQKRHNIKWRNSDEKELERVVRNFNAKIDRQLKTHPERAEFLPDKISKRELKKEIKTRQDFNKEIHSMERFLKKGAEKPLTSKTGNTITEWEKKELSLKVAQINRARTIERQKVENIEALSRGKPVGLKRGEMGNIRTQELQPKKFNFDKIRPGKEWEKFKESVEKQSKSIYSTEKMERFKDNYINALRNVFGNNAEDIISIIKDLSPEDITSTFFADEQASIDFIYDPIDAAAKLDALTEVWENVIDE